MSVKQRNRIVNCESNECEPREMLAAGDPNVSPGRVPRGVASAPAPDPSQLVRFASLGGVEVSVSGNRTFALVATQETRGFRNAQERREFVAETRNDIRRATAIGQSVAVSPESAGGRRITQGESNRIDNARLRVLADSLRAEAYIGETGTSELYRVGDGPLPRAQQRGRAVSVLDLGFEEGAGGNAANARQLPNVLRLTSDTLRATLAAREDVLEIESESGNGIGASNAVFTVPAEVAAAEEAAGIAVSGRNFIAINPISGSVIFT